MENNVLKASNRKLFDGTEYLFFPGKFVFKIICIAIKMNCFAM